MSQQNEITDIKKKILSTGIRVGTAVKTKFMIPYVTQAITEATNAGIPVIGVSNTDNITSKIDLVIPANNRGRKSLATIYWLLARGILLEKDAIKNDNQMKYEIDDFQTKITEEEEIE